ncbi:MAG: MFS transporter [Oscillospiraceae bacterium]|nr:MFS transporter [Oscillospiraceae bacterium]
MAINKKAKNAIYLGVLCAAAYLAVYFARNTLSVVAPQMLEEGVSSEELIGTFSSMFFSFYAVGQLINGIIGDKIKAKYMISGGLLFSGVANVIFTYFIDASSVAAIAYGMVGFFLSMIYGPMTKVVSENTDLKYAVRCSLGYTFSSFLASPMAGVFAAFFVWQSVLNISSAMLVVMAVICFVCFICFEKKGVVKYGQYKAAKGGSKNIKLLIKRSIIKFSFVAILTGVVRTAVVFWLPTYISEYLGFSPEQSATIFTVATFVMSFTSFIVIYVYEKLKNNMDLTLLLSFVVSALSFVVVYLVKEPTVNIIFMVLAVMGANGASTMLWSRYCPSLYDTGMVSSATGFLDFLSYMAASISSSLFANAATTIGWGSLIMVWAGLMVLGIVVALPLRGIFAKFHKSEKAQ